MNYLSKKTPREKLKYLFDELSFCHVSYSDFVQGPLKQILSHRSKYKYEYMAFLCHDDKDKSLMGAPRASKFLNKEKEKLHEMISGEYDYKEHLQ